MAGLVPSVLGKSRRSPDKARGLSGSQVAEVVLKTCLKRLRGARADDTSASAERGSEGG